MGNEWTHAPNDFIHCSMFVPLEDHLRQKCLTNTSTCAFRFHFQITVTNEILIIVVIVFVSVRLALQ